MTPIGVSIAVRRARLSLEQAKIEWAYALESLDLTNCQNPLGRQMTENCGRGQRYGTTT